RKKIKGQPHLVVQLDVVEEHHEEDVGDADERVKGSITAVPSGSCWKPLGNCRRGESSGDTGVQVVNKKSDLIFQMKNGTRSSPRSVSVLVRLAHLNQLALQLLHRPQLAAAHSL
ncbi:hypothetical protein PMAYCL1PPCAC_04012, partial [Pristionchus mayeri]